MIKLHRPRPARRSWRATAHAAPLALALGSALWLAIPSVAGAQAASSATAQQAQVWRDANDRVGRFVRGHIDILREEARLAQSGQLQTPSPAAPTTQAPDVQALYGAMLLRRPDLFIERDASSLQTLEAVSAQAELRHRAHQLWVGMSLALQEQALLAQRVEAAEIAHELGQRMVAVGNWSANQGWMTDLDRMDLHRERLRHAQDIRGLEADLQRLGGVAPASQLRWAPLPAPPAREDLALLNTPTEELEALALARHPAWADLDAQTRLARQGLPAAQEAALSTAMQAWVARSVAVPGDELAAPQPVTVDARDPRWSHAAARAMVQSARLTALEDEVRLQVRDAVGRLSVAHEQALLRLGHDAKLRQAVLDDAQQRYNGMFITTWSLLRALDQHLQAQAQAQQAVAQFWLSHAALQALIAGAPYEPAGGGASAPASAPHAAAARPH